MNPVSYQQLKKLAGQSKGAPDCLALLGDCATQQLATAIAGESVRRGMPLCVYDADYDQLEAQLLDPHSEVYSRNPRFILLFFCTERLKNRFFSTPPEKRPQFAEREAERLSMLRRAVKSNSSAKLLMFDFPEAEDFTFGSYALKTPLSFAYQLRKLNARISEELAKEPSVYPIALSAVQNELGRERFFDSRMWYLAKMPLSSEALPVAAGRVLDTVLAISGAGKKCIVTDLDNTLWGGVIGEDGINGIELGELGAGPAYTALQRMLLEWKERGILLAVCSKNDEETAKEPFLHHPEMLLKLEDFVAFLANWENKAENIRRIQQNLSIGLDSIVFLDDMPFERQLVRDMLPEVTVPELPEDPALVPDFLASLHLFEPAGYSGEDAVRTSQYQAEESRRAAQAQFSDYNDFLRSLDMRAEIFPFDEFHFPRIAQLTQRSNQFNLRTVRYTEAEIAAIAASPEYFTLCMTLADRFGDHGLISVVILKKQDEETLFLDTWLMSCRVLRRGVEECLFDAVVRLARENGFRRLIGEYLPTKKNGMVAELYSTLGMTKTGSGRFELLCENAKPHSPAIRIVEHSETGKSQESPAEGQREVITKADAACSKEPGEVIK